MKIDNKGQAFPQLIILSLGIIMFIFAAPIVGTIIDESIATNNIGTATSFVLKLFLWIVFLVLLTAFYRLISGSEGFFG